MRNKRLNEELSDKLERGVVVPPDRDNLDRWEWWVRNVIEQVKLNLNDSPFRAATEIEYDDYTSEWHVRANATFEGITIRRGSSTSLSAMRTVEQIVAECDRLNELVESRLTRLRGLEMADDIRKDNEQ